MWIRMQNKQKEVGTGVAIRLGGEELADAIIPKGSCLQVPERNM